MYVGKRHVVPIRCLRIRVPVRHARSRSGSHFYVCLYPLVPYSLVWPYEIDVTTVVVDISAIATMLHPSTATKSSDESMSTKSPSENTPSTLVFIINLYEIQARTNCLCATAWSLGDHKHLQVITIIKRRVDYVHIPIAVQVRHK